MNNSSRGTIFGSLSGGVFLIGLAIAILSGHFLLIFLITLGLTSVIGAMSSGNPQATLGGLSGAIFLIGLALAISTPHFLLFFMITLGLTSFVGTLSARNAHATYGGLQSLAFFIGLAICIDTGNWWPGILLVLGVCTILGALHGVITTGLSFVLPVNMARQPQSTPTYTPPTPPVTRPAYNYEAPPPEDEPETSYTGYDQGYRPTQSQPRSQQRPYKVGETEPEITNYDLPQAQYPQAPMPPQQ